MIKIAILGLGTVGTGVVKVVEANTVPIQHKLGQPLSVKTALVRKLRADPYQHLMTEKFREIEHDGEIRVVVETIGGVEAAYEYTRRCLMAGKHVVTANKQLVAEHGCELLELARKNHVNYLFEASVGGGIPVLHPLTQCMAANRVDEIYGILNGTTNFILTKMVKEGASFAEVLKLAQEKGYAEADPTSDVNDVFNAVVVRGNATGEVMFYGKGAGELPTASACVADVIECLQEERHRPEIGWSADTGGFASPLTLKNRWYFRVGTDTLPEALHSAKVLEQGTETAFITPPITGTDAERLAAYLPTLAKMRVLD